MLVNLNINSEEFTVQSKLRRVELLDIYSQDSFNPKDSRQSMSLEQIVDEFYKEKKRKQELKEIKQP